MPKEPSEPESEPHDPCSPNAVRPNNVDEWQDVLRGLNDVDNGRLTTHEDVVKALLDPFSA